MAQQVIDAPDDIIHGPHNKADPPAGQGDAWKPFVDKVINNLTDLDERLIAAEEFIEEVPDIYASLESPEFTGEPKAPTPPAGNNSTRIATTEYVATEYAPLESPVLTGTPTAPTADDEDDSQQIATTAYVDRRVALGAPWTRIIKTVDQTITASDTLVDDNALVVPVEANKNYQIRIVLYSDATTGGWKVSLNGPSDFDLLIAARGSGSNAGLVEDYGETFVGASGSGAIMWRLDVLFRNGPNAGNLALQIAQWIASGSTTYFAGSYLEWSEV